MKNYNFYRESLYSTWDSPATASQEELRGLIGAEAYQRLMNYQQGLKNVKHQQQWRHLFRQAYQVGKELGRLLSVHHEALWNREDSPPPDWNWIHSLTPGLSVIYIAEGSRLDLVRDYAYFQALAKQTPEKDDDKLISLLTLAYGKHETI